MTQNDLLICIRPYASFFLEPCHWQRAEKPPRARQMAQKSSQRNWLLVLGFRLILLPSAQNGHSLAITNTAQGTKGAHHREDDQLQLGHFLRRPKASKFVVVSSIHCCEGALIK